MLQRQLENRAKHNIGVCEHLLSPSKICIKIVFIQYVLSYFPLSPCLTDSPNLPCYPTSCSLSLYQRRKQEKQQKPKKKGNQNKLKIIIRKTSKKCTKKVGVRFDQACSYLATKAWAPKGGKNVFLVATFCTGCKMYSFLSHCFA